ncbi:adenosylcobalamin-dependent ribonucleoside-diphosphate reductase [Thalassotalea piscium]|uniref:Vitamin B12-dependent ribonucleotide reductase n=1 Tax=Thalassotalea piscium TaxID=1230533 RepID=A0A7X0NHV9_9GAMM|nr:adenosylcobalamin-dependent ribonucleoside-diphosphate reductase [Thalassotalea piscium]MBB6543738.1 ribonucleoside-diphosphate reductase alpha chain [Thalassotalea piscium]
MTTQTIGLNTALTSAVELQPASWDIWDKKYRLKDKHGNPQEQTITDTFYRVAKTLAALEPKNKKHWLEQFVWAMECGAYPAGRIISNAGAAEFKPATSTINCTVSGAINDSMTGILSQVHQAGLTLKAGCGIGYEFSTLRPSGAYVAGAGATTSGPLSFMDIFDKMCFTVSSAGGRRGAQMGVFDICHPDVKEFILAKREDGRLRQFNLSLLISDNFINAVKNNQDWHLVFPISQKELSADNIDLDNKALIHFKENCYSEEFIKQHDYIVNEQGLVACKIYQTLPAARLWDMIMTNTFDYAEPGFLLIDHANDMNNNWFCEQLRASNPCGEQILPPYGACLLGSINLVKFVDNPFSAQAQFNWSKFKEVIKVFTRMLDNVVEINGLPLEEQQQEILNKRRHGMGYLGLGSALTMLKFAYNSPQAVAFTEEVSKVLAITGWEEALNLAKEKGPAPILAQQFTVTESMLSKRPEMKEHGIKVGDKIKGAVLHAKYSRYMQRIAQEKPELVEELSKVGARFTHHSSIAPTGTLALSLGNNVSNGIEPSFAHEYHRNIIREGKKSKESVAVSSFELLAYRQRVNPDALPFTDDVTKQLPEYFVASDAISPNAHVDIQAAAQYWIDSSISKTINIPTDFSYEKFKNIYMYAYDKGLKGCTTFRFNPEVHQGVLVKEQDLENVSYEFTLANGTVITAKGNEEISYDGEIHTAANLHDALKEGYYSKL